jgi:membrane-associated phospholipid phosphatase
MLGGLVAFVLIGWGAGALWTSLIGSAEVEFMRELAAQRSPAATTVAKIVTWLGSAWVLVPLALLSCALLARAGLRREAVAVALSLGGAMLISTTVKQLVSRPRPPVEHLQTVTGWSFPSGHASQASAFGFALVLALRAAPIPCCELRLAWAAAAIVTAVALSRVWLGVHYPSDVVAGLLLGGGWAVFVARCPVGRASRLPRRRQVAR